MKFLRLLLFLFASMFIHFCEAANDTPQVNVTPNPTTNIVNITINSSNNDSVALAIYDMLGRLLLQQNYVIHYGNAHLRLNCNEFTNSPGTYLFKFTFTKLNYVRILKVIATEGSAMPRSTQFSIAHTDLQLVVRNLASKQIQGTTTHTLISKRDSLRDIQLDLLKLTVSSVKNNNEVLTFSQNDSQLFIHFNQPLMTGDTANVQIIYSGSPVADASWGGFSFNGNYAYNLGVGFTSDPHSFGRCWYPCVDEFTLKSRYDFHITTDSGFTAVCNGLLQNVTTNSDGSITYDWKEINPLPTYLSSVAVGKYQFVKLTFNGMLKSYPVWIAAEAKDTANARKSMVHLIDALQCFESKFGPYPFERVGYVGVPFNGGAMEHAGNIAYPIYALDGTTNNETLYAHELSHMWWGDLVTCRTPEDMWLNEGWASFCEAVFLECLYGKSAYTKDIQSKLETVMLNAAKTDGAFYSISGVPHDATYGTHVYKKGAVVAHTLRTMMGDSAFFAACKNYLNGHSYSNAGSEDLMQYFQLFTPINLTDFFNNWVYNPGYEDIAIESYMVVDRKLNLTLSYQTRYHDLTSNEVPLTIDLISSNGNKQRVQYNQVWGLTSKVINLDASMPDVQYIIVNPEYAMGFGATRSVNIVKAKGTLNLSTQLTSLSVTAISDSATILVEHHWTEAPQGNLRTKGIRISPERYWHFDGHFPTDFTAYAFFNYDGTPANFLDIDLMKQLTTEDSLVLLFKPFGSNEWSIHTNNTFQPGASKTDKTGRFWVTKLEKGDYAFGLKDYRITGMNQLLTQGNSIVLYPNPANDFAILEFTKPYAGKIFISDINGKIVHEETLNNKLKLGLTLTEYKSGIYFISTESKEVKMALKLIRN